MFFYVEAGRRSEFVLGFLLTKNHLIPLFEGEKTKPIKVTEANVFSAATFFLRADFIYRDCDCLCVSVCV